MTQTQQENINIPQFTVHRQAKIKDVGSFEVYLDIKKDAIKKISIKGDFKIQKDLDTYLYPHLIGVNFNRKDLYTSLYNIDIEDIIPNLGIHQFIRLLLGKLAHVKKPEWLKISLSKDKQFGKTSQIIEEKGLNTICSSGICPNRAECWETGTATFMIGGNICTRACRFCNTDTGKPMMLDPFEPLKVAKSIKMLNLKYTVITSVDRDDLKDYGAEHWKKTILEIRRLNPNTKIEVLIPDFMGHKELLDIVLSANPDVVGHNIETVERLTPLVRSVATYKRSLEVLRYISNRGFIAKTGIMVGLGETKKELVNTFRDLANVGCKSLTIGQYLQPTYNHFPVMEYIEPIKFIGLKMIAEEIGIEKVVSGPLVRSSYHASE